MGAYLRIYFDFNLYCLDCVVGFLHLEVFEMISGIVVLPPQEGMIPNVLVVVRLPSEIYEEVINDNVEELRYSIMAVTEQELNILSAFPVGVDVMIVEHKA